MRKAVLSAVLTLLPLLCAVEARAFILLSSHTNTGLTGLASAADVAVDASGRVYVVGRIVSSGTQTDIWATRYDAALACPMPGCPVMSLDGSGFDDGANGVAVDTVTGSVFITGYISSTGTTAGRDIWVGKYDSGLVLVASTTLAGSASSWDEGLKIRIGRDGALYVVGYSSSAGTFLGPWVGRYDLNLVLLSSMTYPGPNSYGEDVLLASNGSLYVGGARSLSTAVSADAWIGRFDSSYVLQATVTKNGSASNSDSVLRLTEDAGGDIVAVGYLNSGTLADLWIGRYDANLAPLSSMTYNGAGNGHEDLHDVDVLASGDILVTGRLIETAGAGGANIYVAKYTSGLALASSATFSTSGSAADAGYAHAVGTDGSVYVVGEVAESPYNRAWIGRYSLAPATLSSIALSPTSAMVVPGATQQLTAVATFSGGSTVSAAGYAWSTSASSVATVNGSGLVTGVASGAAVITVTSGAVSAAATITVPYQGSYDGYAFNGSGNADDAFYAAARVPGGGYYLVGFTSSSATGADVLLVKVDANLNLLSSATYDGGVGGEDVARGAAVASDGSLYVVGRTSSALSGGRQWVGRYSSALTLVSSTTYLGGVSDANSVLQDVLIEPSGDLVVTGYLVTVPGGGVSVLLARYTPGLVLTATATFTGGFNSDPVDALARSPAGDIFVGGAVAPAPATSANTWLGKFNASLTLVASATVAGAGGNSDQLRGLAFGANGDLYAAGFINNSGVTADVWLARYTTSLVRVSSQSLNGSANSNDEGNGLVAGPGGTMLVAASYNQTGQAKNAFLGEVTESGLALATSTVYTSAGAADDYAHAVVADTTTNVALIVGELAGTNRNGLVARVNLRSPAAPTGFSGAAQSGSSILWSWTDNANNETAYRVISGTVSLSGDLAASATYWLQTGLAASTAYGPYFVRAVSALGSADSATASTSTLVDGCAARASAGSGNWSSGATWTIGSAPTACSPVTVSAGHVVTVDSLAAAASSVTVNGTLAFSRSASAQLSVASGHITVASGAALDMGTSASPIPSTFTARLVLPYSPGTYGLILDAGSSFHIHGAAKSGAAVLTAPGTVNLSLPAAQTSGWQVGDMLVSPYSSSTVSAIGGGDPLTVTVAASLGALSAGDAVINITRNAVIASSDTSSTGSNRAYIQSLIASVTNLVARHAEFRDLGYYNTASKGGFTLNAASARADISSCVFRSNGAGLVSLGASDNVFEANVFHVPAAPNGSALQFFDGARNVIRANTVIGGTGGSAAGGYPNYGFRVEREKHDEIVGNRIRHASRGMYIHTSSESVIANNVVRGAGYSGLEFYANKLLVLESNSLQADGIGGVGSGITGGGVGCASCTLWNNVTWGSAQAGIAGVMSATIISSHITTGNQYGFMGGASDVAVDAYVYGNDYGVFGAVGELIGGGIGYTRTGSATGNISYGVFINGRMTLRASRYLAQASDVNSVDSAADSIISYNQDLASGTVIVQGHYTVSGSTLALDGASALYASGHRLLRVMRGTSVSAVSVDSTSDANAVSQLVTVVYSSATSLWTVTGSSSGVLGTLPAAGGTASFPSGSPQFQLSLTASGAQHRDRVDFVLVAAAKDAGVPKKLLFKPAAAGLQGKSKLLVASDGGFVLRGAAGAPALMDRLSGSVTYYAFSSTGAVTLADALVYNADPGGLQLSGAAGVSIASTTFDYMGVAAATNAYITASALTSGATLQSVTFLTSRSTAALSYNVRVVGVDSGLAWLLRGSAGALWGEAFDADPNNRVAWDGDPITAPGAFAGAALSPTAVLWSWTDNSSNEDGFRVMSGTANYSGDLGPGSASWTQTGLSPDTAYGPYLARAFHATASADSGAASRRTLAAPPTGTAVSSYTAIAATVAWSANGNPATTTAEVHRSTDGAAFALYWSSAASSMRDASLLGCTSYYYKVRHVNGDAVATSFDATVLVRTADTVPAAPAGLSADAVTGGRVALGWVPSPTEGVTAYRLYADGGTGAFNYGAPLAVFTSTETSYTTGVLTSSAAYSYVLRALHRCGVEETAGAFASAASTATLSSVRAVIKNPDGGKRVRGNRVTVMAELASGLPSQVSQVLFQYRASTSAPWTDIVAANVNHPNADLESPYFVHWNVSLLAAGPYHLRAVARDTNGVDDPAPGSILISVVGAAAECDIEENEVAGDIIKRQTVNNAVVNTLAAGGREADDPLAKIVLPPGAVTDSTATVTVEANPTITTAPPSGLTAVGSYLSIELSNGQHDLSNGQTACITMSYPENGVDASRLSIYSYDNAAASWVKDFTSSVNTSSRTVTGCTPHFSIFAVFAGVATATMLDSVRVYPNPYRPNSGNADQGKPFHASDVTTGVIFDNLPAAVTIEIYSLSGRRVARFDTTASGGLIRWDSRNTDGRDVASGGYFAVISSPGLKSTVKKLLIIR